MTGFTPNYVWDFVINEKMNNKTLLSDPWSFMDRILERERENKMETTHIVKSKYFALRIIYA